MENEITQLLAAVEAGDPEAGERLLPATCEAQDALSRTEAENAALATANREAELRLAGCKLNRKNVEAQEWADVREVLELFLGNSSADHDETSVSCHGIKMAGICLTMDDRDAYEATGAR